MGWSCQALCSPVLSCTPPPAAWPPTLLSFLSTLLELATYALLLYWSVHYFSLEIDWEKGLLESKVGTSLLHWGGHPHGPAVPVGTAAGPDCCPPPQPSRTTSSRSGYEQ